MSALPYTYIGCCMFLYPARCATSTKSCKLALWSSCWVHANRLIITCATTPHTNVNVSYTHTHTSMYVYRFLCASAACANRFRVDSTNGATHKDLLTYKCVETYSHICIYSFIQQPHTYACALKSSHHRQSTDYDLRPPSTRIDWVLHCSIVVATTKH